MSEPRRPFVQENDQPKGEPTWRQVLETQAVPERLRKARLNCFDLCVADGHSENDSYAAANQIIHVR